MLLYEDKNIDQALKCFKCATERGDTKPEKNFALTDTKKRTVKTAEAENILKSSVQIIPLHLSR